MPCSRAAYSRPAYINVSASGLVLFHKRSDILRLDERGDGDVNGIGVTNLESSELLRLWAVVSIRDRNHNARVGFLPCES